MVTDFVRHHIGLGEIAGRAEPALQFVEKAEIDIDLLISGTVKRTGRRARQTRRPTSLYSLTAQFCFHVLSVTISPAGFPVLHP